MVKGSQQVLDDKILIKDIKKYKCSGCIEKLREKHLGLVLDIYSKYSSVLWSLNFIPDDFTNDINYIIFNSARKFDLRKKNIKFSSWLGQQVKYFCLNKITELNKNRSIALEPEGITKIIDECFSQSDNSNNHKELCDYIFSILEQIKDKRVMQIFNYRYFSGEKNKLTWKEIGVKMNLTSQGCINIHNKTLKLLKDKLTSKIEHDKI